MFSHMESSKSAGLSAANRFNFPFSWLNQTLPVTPQTRTGAKNTLPSLSLVSKQGVERAALVQVSVSTQPVMHAVSRTTAAENCNASEWAAAITALAIKKGKVKQEDGELLSAWLKSAFEIEAKSLNRCLEMSHQRMQVEKVKERFFEYMADEAHSNLIYVKKNRSINLFLIVITGWDICSFEINTKLIKN